MKPHFTLGTPWLTLTALVLGQALAASASAQSTPDRSVAAVALPSALPDTRSAEAAPAPAAVNAPAAAAGARRIDIGSATEGLLAMQRAAASPHPRNIDGEQASRSYQRYLKSFETAIPERYSTGLDLSKR